MAALTKVAVFVDESGRPLRKVGARVALERNDVEKHTVKDKPGFYVPSSFEEIVTDALSAGETDSEG